MTHYLAKAVSARARSVFLAAALCSVGAIGSLVTTPVWAVQAFKVLDIRVEGLQRVEPGTVFASLPFRNGDEYTDDKGSTAIRALFGLGLFNDVRIELQGNVVVVVVQERPTVSDVSFSGIKEFESPALTKALRDVGLAEGRAFDKALADRAEQELKRQYINRGMYAVKVVATVTPIERNRVNVNFSVVEGGVATIKELRIVGAQAFPESDLTDLFSLDTGGFMSWYTKSNRYSKTKLNGDLDALRSFYLTRGFIEFAIDSTQVAIAPEKDEISIIINITEGKRYVVSGVRLLGDYLGKDSEFASKVSIEAGKPYNVDAVTETTQAFTDYFGEFGYAFARVEAVPNIDRANAQVEIALQAQPSRRAYVRRIDIEGNDRTRDEVIRREFRQMEASWYDGKRIRLSRDRVDRLGFFTDVSVQPREVPGAPDQVDLALAVTERPTGNLSIGAGYSQSEKLSFIAGIQQENVFGTGNYLGLSFNTSKFNRELSLTTTDPYFTRDGISRSFDVSYATTEPLDSQGGDYTLVRKRGGVRFGVPFSETDTVFFGAGLESTSINIVAGTTLPNVYRDFVDAYGSPATSVPLTVGWARDGRDSSLVPTEGRYQRVNGELGIAGDTRYVKADYQFQQYWPLTKKYTLAFNSEFGFGKGLGGRELPVFKNYYGGGLGSVRGFDQGTLGGLSTVGTPAAPGTPVSIGGSRSVLLNTEFIAPFPGVGNDRTLRMFAFIDVGNVYCTPSANVICTNNSLRASSGVGLSWISPVGPLRLSYANALRKQTGDKLQTFQFQIGTSF
jgi:outer membrane protein insertion porin family